jgi:hypothetical protein
MDEPSHTPIPRRSADGFRTERQLRHSGSHFGPVRLRDQTIEKEPGDLSITLRHIDQYCCARHIGKIIVLPRRPGVNTIDRRYRRHSHLAADRAPGPGRGLLRREDDHEATIDRILNQCAANWPFAVSSKNRPICFKGSI